MSKLFFFLTFTFAVFLEAAITSVPIVLDALLVFYILKRSSRIFVPAFATGIFLDVFAVRTIGVSSIFFIAFIFIIFQYGRKFEIATYPFVFFASFLGGLTYLAIFKYDHIFGQAVVSSIIAILLFFVIPNLFRNLGDKRS